MTTNHANLTREITVQHPFHSAFIIGQAQRAALKTCGCNKWHCELCGFRKFHLRLRRVAHSGIKVGYLTGATKKMEVT